jgi:hypothetical protein
MRKISTSILIILSGFFALSANAGVKATIEIINNTYHPIYFLHSSEPKDGHWLDGHEPPSFIASMQNTVITAQANRKHIGTSFELSYGNPDPKNPVYTSHCEALVSRSADQHDSEIHMGSFSGFNCQISYDPTSKHGTLVFYDKE